MSRTRPSSTMPFSPAAAPPPAAQTESRRERPRRAAKPEKLFHPEPDTPGLSHTPRAPDPCQSRSASGPHGAAARSCGTDGRQWSTWACQSWAKPADRGIRIHAEGMQHISLHFIAPNQIERPEKALPQDSSHLNLLQHVGYPQQLLPLDPERHQPQRFILVPASHLNIVVLRPCLQKVPAIVQQQLLCLLGGRHNFVGVGAHQVAVDPAAGFRIHHAVAHLLLFLPLFPSRRRSRQK